MFLKTGDFVQPSDTWVLVDEHPDSMNDGFFCTQMNPAPNLGSAELPDCPASYHNGACGFSFADGHSETHQWRNAATLNHGEGAPGSGSANPADWVDWQWLTTRTSAGVQ